ncbi:MULTISPECIES: serine hydrolase [unclassified Streptomyces]|uniref:serine hydrolase n=1 Tax=unclassified Streptomyces TaxID=2593676 RepID=UPI00226F8610|nr:MULTISPECIES: serine hydrolase domain-containing protein [unclassified Streptomyces]MCY0922269.1 serine hydrolase [Streptomyces sp. H27-G5]MCY0957930.1 serine hydrolase [Streptomyces sp. H27-H5]
MGRYKGRSLGGLILLVVLAGSACQSPQAGSAVSGGSDSGALDARTEAKVKQIVRRFKDTNTNRTPGHLEPEGDLRQCHRRRRPRDGAPLRTDMQFKIASQTKAFTANLVLQLVGEGKVVLEDHISKWVPGVPNGDRITIRRLLFAVHGDPADPVVAGSG